ncbi:MAG: DegV family protein [Anaerolineales bacterium]|nr:DegV family protein [Anaerolineales bacterium]
MTIIVADTTCGLPRDLLAKRGIPLIPQVVMFGEEAYHDDKELDTATFLQKLKASPTLPKTAAPEPPLYYPIFKQAQEKGESVVVIAPSAKVSGTVRSAEIAAQEFPGLDIRVIDSLTVSCNLGSLVLVADDMAKAGASADEIEAKIRAMIPRGRIFFVVDTLEYLAKGGRIGGAKKLLAELLEIKPILTIREGQVEPFEQQRTKKRALARLAEVVAEGCPGNAESYLSVLQVEAESEAQAFVADLKERVLVPNIPIYELPPAIVVHGGPKTMGVGFFV